MYIRNTFSEKKKMSLIAALGLLLLAAVCLAYQYWPQRKANLALAYFTDDDGKTWFKESSYRIAPFDHDGKTAVIAKIYTYDNGAKKYCAYVAEYTPQAKQRLEAAVADAQAKGEPPSSVDLFHQRDFIVSAMQVKLPGDNNPWIPYLDPRANQVFSIHSPDGSVVDEVFVY
ncbi:MAG: hypothetical protein ABSB33_01685 [Tepidisphaeraceae bacterium]|jgi:hypothetical protein